MKFGQRYDGKGHISKYADYVQLNICGLSAIDIVQKYFLYDIDKPIILLGDYTSKGRNAREDDMLDAERIYEIKDAISSLKAFGAEIWGITIHPVSRNGLSKFGENQNAFKDFVDKLADIYQIPVLVKNREDESLHLSKPKEIIEFSYTNKMTLDSTHLYEVCGYKRDYYLDVISRINMNNVQELHISNMSIDKNGIVGNRELNNNEVKISDVFHIIKKVPWATFTFAEGVGHPQFDSIIQALVKKVRENDRD